MTTYFVAVITLNLVCFLFILLSGIQHKKHHYYSLAIVNLLLIGYHFLSWRFHLAASVSEERTIGSTSLVMAGRSFSHTSSEMLALAMIAGG